MSKLLHAFYWKSNEFNHIHIHICYKKLVNREQGQNNMWQIASCCRILSETTFH